MIVLISLKNFIREATHKFRLFVLISPIIMWVERATTLIQSDGASMDEEGVQENLECEHSPGLRPVSSFPADLD